MARPKKLAQSEFVQDENEYQYNGYEITVEQAEDEGLRVVVSERGLYVTAFDSEEQAKEYIDNVTP